MNANPKCTNTHVVCGEYLMMYDHEGELVVCPNCNVGPTQQPASKSAPTPIPSQKLVSPAVTAPAPRAEPETKLPQVTVDERKKYDELLAGIINMGTPLGFDFSKMAVIAAMWCNRCRVMDGDARPKGVITCKFCKDCGDEMVTPETARVMDTCGACDQRYERDLLAKHCGKCGSLVNDEIEKRQKILVEFDAPIAFDALVEFSVGDQKFTNTMLANTEKMWLLVGDIPSGHKWYRGKWTVRALHYPTLVRRVRLSHLQKVTAVRSNERHVRIKLETLAVGEVAN